MPVTPPVTYPGVYIQEVPSGVSTITAVSTATTVFIGRALRGPVNDPTPIDNFGQFNRFFGSYFIGSEMAYAVYDFFLNGGQQAIILRLYNPLKPDKKSKRVKKDQDKHRHENMHGVAVSNALNLVAANPGMWGNQLEVSIDRQGITAEIAQLLNVSSVNDLFNLTVKDTSKNGATERFTNLSIVPIKDTPSLAQVLEQQSLLVRIRANANGKPDNPTTLPTADKLFTFTGGEDGRPLKKKHFIGKKENKTGLYALDATDIFNLMCIPPDQRGGDIDTAVYQAALKYCYKRHAFLIMDSPFDWGAQAATAVDKAINGFNNMSDLTSGPEAHNGAIYFPRVIKVDPIYKNKTDTFAPSGIIAGIMARSDMTRGVWKAPAGTEATLNGAQELQVNIDDQGNGRLNQLGINCLRNFQVYGPVVWGARTLKGAEQLSDEYKFISVRRLLLMIEETLYRGTQWAVFEPNDESLWAQLRMSVGGFMADLFNQGAFQGQSAADAYFVRCDSTTTTPSDIENGVVNMMIGFAPMTPAEFIVLTIQQIAGGRE